MLPHSRRSRSASMNRAATPQKLLGQAAPLVATKWRDLSGLRLRTYPGIADVSFWKNGSRNESLKKRLPPIQEAIRSSRSFR